MAVVCKCTTARMSFFCFREVSLDDKPDRRNLLRNVSTLPVFKKGLFTRWSPSLAGNSILSMDARENLRSSILSSSLDNRIPIYVMMHVDAFCIDGTGRPRIRKIKAFTVALKALKLAGINGIAVEVWWGIIEHFSPLAYDWSLYEELFKLISDSSLKLHVALSFHSSVNSSSSRKGGVTLPLWIIEDGRPKDGSTQGRKASVGKEGTTKCWLLQQSPI